MWFKPKPVSEHERESERERNFLTTVMSKAGTVLASQWRKSQEESSTGRDTVYGRETTIVKTTNYETFLGEGVKVVLSFRNTYGNGDNIFYYTLQVETETIARYKRRSDSEGQVFETGNEQAATLYKHVSKLVEDFEYKKAKPEREALAAESNKLHTQRTAEEEKKRQNILRRL